ncbi:MAG: indolepyruvate ferredoxin oxidoreductase family protein, partial [Gammaproteobacteria bacterium]
YFQLLAYKDEYEVARLYSNGEFEKTLSEHFEGDYRLRFHLAPPLLAKRDKITGAPLKREFGGWVMPLFRLLARFRGLRGSALDPFGYSAERKMERQLIADFERDSAQLLDGLNRQNIGTAVTIASLPQKIRGFGHVKQDSIETFHQARAKLLQNFDADDGVDGYKP